MPDLKKQKREQAAELLSATLGPRWRVILARALELEPSAVRRMFSPPKGRTDAPSTALLAVAELLAATDRAHWPERWAKAERPPIK